MVRRFLLPAGFPRLPFLTRALFLGSAFSLIWPPIREVKWNADSQLRQSRMLRKRCFHRFIELGFETGIPIEYIFGLPSALVVVAQPDETLNSTVTATPFSHKGRACWPLFERRQLRDQFLKAGMATTIVRADLGEIDIGEGQGRDHCCRERPA
ncbi:hypothetical protein A33O_14981 [Nitratireductor aquibiodomus RA22]|uniref:Uncharacterized protein n=1 Tax=Nitratireductor aquibiodomus RA22 TaxID=1189611 RepID=I5BVA1_9HYPH|nr:hypothetical protein A33O_14981 [Nitratireductor aquibiodomus RA22]